MSSLEPLNSSILQNTVNASQQEINAILKQLETGLRINSSADDPANLYVSDKLNLEALENASTASNAQSGLTYLQIAQKAYSDIVTELNKVKDLANLALNGSYTSTQIDDFQKQITDSINAIKLIESGTTFNGIQVFNNVNSAGLVNEHMFAITSKTDVTITTATLVDDRGKDFSAYLSNPTIHRYEKLDVGGTITLKNDLGATLTPGANLVTIETAAQLVSALSSTVTAGRTFILLDNIDLSSLGTKTAALIAGTFKGTFDGNGYAVSGLQISSTADSVGLFNTIGAGATVKNLVLNDFAVKGNSSVGTLAGLITGGAVVNNVATLDVLVSGNLGVGGLVGAINNGSVTNTYATGKVFGDSLSVNVGGLVGDNITALSAVRNSFANVDVTGGTNIGGLVGGNDVGIISQSYARGDVIAKNRGGGLVGYNNGAIDNTYSLGTVTGQTNTAGLVGENYGAGATVTNSYSLSSVVDSTTTYDIANFQIAATTENVAGSAQRPNDAFSITFDYAGKTYAFDTIDNFNKFKDFTLGSPSGEVELLYEKDVATNTWYGRKLKATNLYSYTSSALPDAPINGVPEDNNGVSYSVLTTLAVAGFAAAGTYAFKNEAEKNSFLTFNSTNTTTTNIDKFYKLDAPNNQWNSQALTVNASTYAVQAGAGSSFANTPLSSYGLFNDLWTDTTGAYSAGVANTVYAFSTEEDKNAFVNGNAEIGLFYKANASNTWSALKQSLGAAGTYSYVSTDIATATAGDDPQDDLNHYVYLTGDKLNAFSSQEDLDNYNNGAAIGEITKYYAKTAPDTWTAKRITKTVSTVYVPASSGAPVDSAPIDSDGVLYSFVKNVTGTYAGTYAFATQTDFDNFHNGDPIGIIGAYYKKVGTLTNAWEKYQVTKTDGFITYASAPVGAPNIDSAPLDSDGINYNIVKNIAAGPAIGNYRFASQADADNFNNGISFLGEVSKFYKYDSGNDKWQALTIKSDVAAPVTPVAVGGPTGTVTSSPVDQEGLIYSYTKTAYNANDGKTYTYAFASVTDMNNFVDVNHFRALIGRFYEDRADGSTNPWMGYSTTFDASATITDTGTNVVSKPETPDGLNYNIFRTDGSGNTLAFASQVDADNWNNGTFKDSISKYYIHLTTDPATQWRGYSITQTAAYVTYSYSVGGLGPVKHAMPHDADGISYAIEKNIPSGFAAGDYRFSSQADADSFNDGFNFTGTVAKFYKYNTVDDTWEAQTLYAAPAVVSLGISVQSGPIDSDGVAYTYKKTALDNGGTGTLRTYAFASVSDMNNFVNDKTFLAAIGRYYVDAQDGSDNPWDARTVKTTATETATVIGSVGGTLCMPVATEFKDMHRNATNDGWLAFASYDDYWNQFLNPKADKSVMYLQKMDADTTTTWTVWHTTLQQGETTMVTGDLASMPPEYNLLGHTAGGGTVNYYCSNAQDQADFIAWGNGTLDHSVNFNTVVDYGYGVYAHENVFAYYSGHTQIAGTYASKPFDQDYNVILDYGSSDPKGSKQEYGLGQYYFASEADSLTFQGINNYFYNAKPANLRPTDDAMITYYKRNDSSTDWTKLTLTYKAAALPAGSTHVGWAYNKPDDASFNIAYGPDSAGTGYLTTALASGSGFYYFQTDADKTAFTNYINGSTDSFGANYYVMVSNDPTNAVNDRTWEKKHISFGEKSGSINQRSLGVSVVSQPLDATYSYYNALNGGWFASVAEADIFNQWQNGGLRTGLDGTGKTFNDIYWYQHKGTDVGTPKSWFAYKLWDVLHPATYASTAAGVVSSRPSDNSFAVAGVDPNDSNNILYFNSTGDKDTYIQYLTDKKNGIDPTATFDINYYEYNSGANRWDQKKAVEKVTRNVISWIYTRPADVNYNFTDTANHGFYSTSGKANGDGLYFFQSDSDKVTFENYLAGSDSPFNITYFHLASAYSSYFSPTYDSSFNPRTWTKYNLEKLNPLSQSAIATPEVASKPKTISYDILSTYGGGQYYFATEGEKQTFESFKAGTLAGSGLAFSDIYYYEKTGAGATSNWKENKLSSVVTSDKYDKIGPSGTVNSRPNDPNFGQNLMYTYAGQVPPGTDYTGTFFFSSVDDEAIFNKVRQGLQTGDIPNVYYYKYNGGTNKWDRNKLTSTTSTIYNAPVNLGPVHTGSPSTLGYEKVWKQDASNEFAFNSALDMSNFQAYKAGTLTGNVDMMYYYRVNDTTWQQARITSTLGAASYAVMPRVVDNTIGRPVKDGYDILSGDGLKAFANSADLATYNNGTPTGLIDLFYIYNGATKQWDANKTQKNTDTYTNASTGTQVDGIPVEEGYGTNAKIGGVFYAFKDATDLANFNAALTQGWGVSNATRIAGIDKYYQYNTGNNTWQSKKVGETTTQSYAIVAKTTPNITGMPEHPNMDGYSYLTTIAAGAHIGTYAFKSADDRTSFLNFDAGTGSVNPISNYYKLNTVAKIADPVSGKLIDSWDGQRLDYNNNTGFLIGKNTGSVVGSFYGNGEATANYTFDGVQILGNTEIAADANPINTWSGAIWDTTSTAKPILKSTKSEGSEEIKETNLAELLDETKYVYTIYDSYSTNDLKLNVALVGGTTTAVVPASAPGGYDLAGRPNVAKITLAGLANKYLSDVNVYKDGDPNTKYTEGKDYVLYTNDNGASWNMDILSSDMYSKTIRIDYQGVATGSANQGTSGFNIYLGDNKNMNIKDMTLDLAGRLNFNLTRVGGVNGTKDAVTEILDYMTYKQSVIAGEITMATNALSNKTSQNKTMVAAVGNIQNVDEAKTKALLAKQQLLQSKTDAILQKFYNLQTSSMQSLLSVNFSQNSSIYGGIYQGMTGVNNLYSKSIIDYNYNATYGA